MRNELIDSLTRVLATPTANRAPANRSTWRIVTTTAVSGFWALLGRSLVEPQSAFASTEAISPGCETVNSDGQCPVDKPKRTQSGNVPTTNGCGPEGGSIKIPQGYGDADYTGSCNNHDVCYEECATAKNTCDENFRDQMYDSCSQAYAGVLNSLYRMGCYERAYAYYQAVSQFGGDAWNAAQKKACECCPEKQSYIYCGCPGHEKCYTDAGSCTSECPGGLACFGYTICGPATEEQCPA